MSKLKDEQFYDGATKNNASETASERCAACGIWTPVHRNYCIQCREKNNNFSPEAFCEQFGMTIEAAQADCAREHAMIRMFLEEFIEDFPFCDQCGDRIKTTPLATK